MKAFTTATSCILLLAFLRGAYSAGGGMEPDWSYDDPSQWVKDYPLCGGRRQSPIDIITSKVVLDPTSDPFVFHGFDNSGLGLTLVNTGHNAAVSVTGGTVTVSGGGLHGTYILKQFHFHWGDPADGKTGSEHLVNNFRNYMEMHWVFYNSKYESIDEAKTQPDGLAVIAFFIKAGAHNANYDEIVNNLKNIIHSEDEKHLNSFTLESLFPDRSAAIVSRRYAYWRYDGSLTTPKCFETVTWSVFKKRVHLSIAQMDKFTQLFDEHENRMINNYRPVQPLNNRVVLTNKGRGLSGYDGDNGGENGGENGAENGGDNGGENGRENGRENGGHETGTGTGSGRNGENGGENGWENGVNNGANNGGENGAENGSEI